MQTILKANETFRTENGNLAMQTEALQFRLCELKTSFPKVADEINNLKVKVRRSRFYSQNSFENEKQIKVHLKDSLHTDAAQLQTFCYTDSFYNVCGVVKGDSAQLNICSHDTLIQVIYKGERINKWLWIFSKRKMMQRVTLKNPNAKINYSQLIQIQTGHEFKL